MITFIEHFWYWLDIKLFSTFHGKVEFFTSFIIFIPGMAHTNPVLQIMINLPSMLCYYQLLSILSIKVEYESESEEEAGQEEEEDDFGFPKIFEEANKQTVKRKQVATEETSENSAR